MIYSINEKYGCDKKAFKRFIQLRTLNSKAKFMIAIDDWNEGSGNFSSDSKLIDM